MLEEGSWRILANGWAWKRLRGGQKTKRELWLKEGDKNSIFFFSTKWLMSKGKGISCLLSM